MEGPTLVSQTPQNSPHRARGGTGSPSVASSHTTSPDTLLPLYYPADILPCHVSLFLSPRKAEKPLLCSLARGDISLEHWLWAKLCLLE